MGSHKAVNTKKYINTEKNRYEAALSKLTNSFLGNSGPIFDGSLILNTSP